MSFTNDRRNQDSHQKNQEGKAAGPKYILVEALKFGGENKSQWIGKKHTSSKYQRKEIRANVRTTKAHYGVPDNIVNIIQNSYDGIHCNVVYEGRLADAFQVRIRVRQGCVLSSFLFLLVVDWITKTSTSGGTHGIKWTDRNQLEDLDIADDLALSIPYTSTNAG
ncbi:unnamed protein product [Schistosoma mattheei]|uniref:Uncharacterized protein n=1 Tax=Schistosoma mattheei TaxID=31246 RepID=A0A183PXG0_9TREM|nr:unnamed protein product [Schistosoma mattheei]